MWIFRVVECRGRSLSSRRRRRRASRAESGWMGWIVMHIKSRLAYFETGTHTLCADVELGGPHGGVESHFTTNHRFVVL